MPTQVPLRMVLTGWRTITEGRGKMVGGMYVRGAAIAQANWTNHTYRYYSGLSGGKHRTSL